MAAESVDAEKNPEEILKALRMDGLSRNEEEILSLLDQTFAPGKHSSVIPVAYNKNGNLAWYSKVAQKEDFDVIQRYTDRKIRQIGRQILDGATDVSPCLTDKKDSCTYGPYHGICGFDERIPGFSYRRFRKLSQEEVLERLREELGSQTPGSEEEKEEGGD